MMAVMTEARATDVEQEGRTSHWVEVKGGVVLTSRVVSPAPVYIAHFFIGKAIAHMTKIDI